VNFLKEIIVWDKVNAQPALSEGVLNSQHEVVLVFDKNNSIKRKFEKFNFKRGTLSNLWRIKREKSECENHGAVFPERLAEKVICNFSNEGDIVLDPFMGTGTTGVVCRKNNRKFIGIEIDDEYFNISKKRIEEQLIVRKIF
jgi:site-specific DNA-methyltransferase (adenine-specific)/modification methylase